MASSFARSSVLVVALGVAVVGLNGLNPAEAARLPSVSAVAAPDALAVARVAPALTATLTDALVTDGDSDGNADAGDVIAYTVVIENTGADPATNVTVSATLDANTTLVPGSLDALGVVRDDAYATAGNVTLTVDAGAGVLANDADPDGSGLAATPITAFDAASAEGGTVTLDTSNGSFSYAPPAGFTGTDTFTYTVDDGEGNAGVGTVTVTLTETVWFVDASAPAGGDGTEAAPFQTLAPLNDDGTDPDDPGDVLFVYEGTYDTGAPVVLEADQALVGQGVDLVVGAETVVNGSLAQRPVLTNSAGAGFTLATDNTVRGLDVGASGAAVAGAGVSGTNYGTFTMDAASITTDGGPALDLLTGTVAVTLDAITVTAGAPFGLRTSFMSGALAVTGASSIQGSVGAQVGLANSADATFGALDLDGTGGAGLATSGSGTVSITDGASTIDAVGGPAIDQRSQASLDLTLASMSSTNSVPSLTEDGNGLNLERGINSSITVSGTTTISNPAANGIRVHFQQPAAFDFGTVSISTPGQDGVHLSNSRGTYDFGDATLTDAGGDGIDLDNSGTSTVTFGAGSSISGATGDGLYVRGGAPGITYAGTITSTTGNSVDVANTIFGTVTVSGLVDDDGDGIVLADNAATITFSGRLDLDTGASPALTATGTGTVHVTGSSNAFATTSASALVCDGATLAGTFHDVDVTAGASAGVSLTHCPGTKVFGDVQIVTAGATGFAASNAGTLSMPIASGDAGTSTVATTGAAAVSLATSTLGTGGVVFRSVTASGGTNGILLSTLGGSGGFAVTGDGPSDPSVSTRGTTASGGVTPGSGGTIASTTGAGVSLSSVSGVALRNLVVGDPAAAEGDPADNTNAVPADGISADDVDGLTLDNVLVSRTGRHGLFANDLTDLTVRNAEFLNNGDSSVNNGGVVGEHAFSLTDLFGTSAILNTVIDGHSSRGIAVNNRASGSSPDRLAVTNVLVTGSHPSLGEAGIGVVIPAGSSADFRLDVSGSEVLDVVGNAIDVATEGLSSSDVHLSVTGTTLRGSGTSSPSRVPIGVRVAAGGDAGATFSISENGLNSFGGPAPGGFSDLPTAGIRIENEGTGRVEGVVEHTVAESPGVAVDVIAGKAGSFASSQTVVRLDGNTATSTDAGGSSGFKAGVGLAVLGNSGAELHATVEDNDIGSANDFSSGLDLLIADGALGCFNVFDNDLSAASAFDRALALGVNDSGSEGHIQGYTGSHNDESGVESHLLTNNTIVTGRVNANFSGGASVPAFPPACQTPTIPPALAPPPVKSVPLAHVDLAALTPAALGIEPVEATPAAPTPRTDRAPTLAAPTAHALALPAAALAAAPSARAAAGASGETVTLNVGTVPAGESVTVTFRATVDDPVPFGTTALCLQGTATADGGLSESTDDPDTGPAGDATCTPTEPTPPVATLTGSEGWRMLAAPATGATLGDLLGPLWTQGFAEADEPSGPPNVYGYTESVTADTDGSGTADGDDGFTVPGAQSDPFAPGTGRFVYVFADDDAADGEDDIDGDFPKTLSVAGPEPAAPFAFSPSFTPSGTAADDGWALVGNPFQAGLDWDAPGWVKTNMSNAIYVYDPAQDKHLEWTGTTGDLGGGEIAAYQGFWVQATADPPTLQAPAAARIASPAVIGREVSDAVVLGLRVEGAIGGANRADDAFLSFQDGADARVDRFDAYALPGFEAEALSLAAVAPDGEGLSVSAVPFGDVTEVPLAVVATASTAADAALLLTWPTLEVPEAWALTLVDTRTGEEVDLRTADRYAFVADVKASARRPGAALRAPRPLRFGGEAARASARFTLRITTAATAAADTPTGVLALAAWPNPSVGGAVTIRYTVPDAGPVRVAVFDALGREVAVLVDGPSPAGAHAVTLPTEALPGGTYLVRLVSGAGARTQAIAVAR